MSKFVKAILEKFKAANPAATPEQISDFEKGIEPLLPKDDTPAPTPATGKSDATVMQLPPEVLEAITTQGKSITQLHDALGKLVADLDKRNQSAAEQQQAANSKKYTDHLAKLLTEGRLTKAEHDDYAKADGDKAKGILGSDTTLNLFIESSSRWAVNPAFAKKPGDPNPQNNQQSQTKSRYTEEIVITPEMKADMAAEFKATNK